MLFSGELLIADGDAVGYGAKCFGDVPRIRSDCMPVSWRVIATGDRRALVRHVFVVAELLRSTNWEVRVGTGSGNSTNDRPVIRGFSELIVVALACPALLSNAAASNRPKPLLWVALASIRRRAGSSPLDVPISPVCGHEPGAFKFAWAVTIPTGMGMASETLGACDWA
jgi:hypothetical protein